MREYTYDEVLDILKQRDDEEAATQHGSVSTQRRKARTNRKRSKLVARERNRPIYEAAKDGPCSVCGQQPPGIVMNLIVKPEFMHQGMPPISQRLKVWSEARLLAEIEMRRRVCSNCLPYATGLMDPVIDVAKKVQEAYDEAQQAEIEKILATSGFDLTDDSVAELFEIHVNSGDSGYEPYPHLSDPK